MLYKIISAEAVIKSGSVEHYPKRLLPRKIMHVEAAAFL